MHARIKARDGPCDKGGRGYPAGRSATVREIGERTGTTTELCGPPRRSCRRKTLLRAVATFVRVRASAKLCRTAIILWASCGDQVFGLRRPYHTHTCAYIHARVSIALPFPFGSLRCLAEKVKSGREPDQPFSYISRPAHATVARVGCQRSPMVTSDNRGYRRIIIVVLAFAETRAGPDEPSAGAVLGEALAHGTVTIAVGTLSADFRDSAFS